VYLGIHLSTGDLEFFFDIVDGNPREHENFVGEKDAENSADKNDELVTIEGFEPPAVYVDGSLLTCLVKAGLFFLPHEEGGGERFHGDDDIDVHP
jgi:hypothetical protein